jgi:hypothetical protein
MVHHKLSSSSVWTNSAELGDVNTYTITGLSHSTAYLVAVTAINSVGSAVKSSSITVTTLAPFLITTGPTNLAVSSKTNKQVAVTWTNVTNATLYMVHYKLTNSTVWTNSAYLGNIASHTITGLSASTSYYVTVTAIDSSGSSKKANEITVTTFTTPATPTGLTTTTKTDTTIKINWTLVAGHTY